MSTLIKVLKAFYDWLMDYSVIDKMTVVESNESTPNNHDINVVMFQHRTHKCVYIARSKRTGERYIKGMICSIIGSILFRRFTKNPRYGSVIVRDYLNKKKITTSSYEWTSVVLKSGLNKTEANQYVEETLDVYENLGYFVINPTL